MTAHELKAFVWQAVRYGLTGIVNTTVGLGVMVAGAAIGLHYAVYTAIAYFIGLLVSFSLNLRFTFRTEGRLWQRFQGFLAVCLACLALAQLVQAALIEGAGVAEPIGVGAGMVTYTVIGFFLNRRFVFRPLGSRHAASGDLGFAAAAAAVPPSTGAPLGCQRVGCEVDGL